MSDGTRTILDDEQRFILMKFKRNIRDIIKPSHTDEFLLRWLRARAWNVDAAEKMIRESMKWRLQWEVDTALPDWTQPEVIRLYCPHGVSGFDKDGAPIIIVPFGSFDIVGCLHSVSKQDLMRTVAQILEKNLKVAAETGANSVVTIFDMDGFSLRPYTWRPAAEFILSMVQTYEANFPEILKACYIINAPAVFAIGFNVVKKFLNPCTLAKIQIFKKEPEKWKAAVLSNIEPDQLPKYYGGTLEDPDGNPKCVTKINQGGKIPKSYYIKNLQVQDDLSPKLEYKTIIVKKGKKETLDFEVTEEGCFLKWIFKSDDHDIRFGITLRDAEGNTSPAVRHSRVSAHQIEESGVLACQAPATYTVTFDNTYSILRNKTIHHCIFISSPANEVDILPSENDEVEGLSDEVEGKLQF